MSSMAADVISANLAPGAMAEPAQNLLAAISRRDVSELNNAVRLFETQVMLDAGVSAYGGRWLAGVSKAHVPGLAQMIQIESLLGEMRGGGDALSIWVAQCWAESDGHQKLVHLAEAMIGAWRDLQTEQAIRFACALATSLAVIQTKVASRMMSRIESLINPPKAVNPAINLAASWVDVGCILTQLSPSAQSLLEERLANSERRWEWSSPEASNALEELRPHLSAPSKASRLFRTIVWEDAWPMGDVQGLDDHFLGQPASAPALTSLPPPLVQPLRKKPEPVRLLILVTLLLAMTLVYNAVNAQRQAGMQRPVSSARMPKPTSHAAPFGTQAMRQKVS
ncbi:MAG: hypothetical protein JWO08_2073 [Verrucomicrobiaceae bacterium]|nr:hypothetical protein [Verrucomicrobiaceae bacterium]